MPKLDNKDINEVAFLERRLKVLMNITQLKDADIPTICDHILEEILKITDSLYGFYGFLDDTESAMTIYSWSTEALKACRITDKPLVFSIPDSGIWGNAVRSREPFVLNDYTAPAEHKKGLPEGHVALTRVLSVPVLSAGKVKAVAAVANKQTPYCEQDTRQLQAFLSHCQLLIDQRATEQALREQLAATRRISREMDALHGATKAVLSSSSFTHCARIVFDYCRELIGADSGYVALLNERGDENEVLFLEAGGRPCTVAPDLPMPIRGLRAESFRTGKVVFENDFEGSAWKAFMPDGHVKLDNVLFAPLKIDGKVAGLLGIANKPDDFSVQDAETAAGFAEIAAIALKNSRDLESLRKSEEKFSKSFQKSPALMSISDADNGRYLDVNERFLELSGYKREEVLGTLSTDLGLITQESRRLIADSLARRGFVSDLELKLKRKNGEPLVVCYFGELIDYDGKKRLLSIAQDITAVKKAGDEKSQMENQLRQAQKMEALGTLAGGIAHDFNNLLGVIIGYSDLAMEDLHEGDPAEESIDQVLAAANRAKDLVQQILTFSRQKPTLVGPLAAQPILKEAVKLLRATLPATIEIEIDISADCGPVEAEPSELHQIVMNLCTNAYHAMEERGGRLRVTFGDCADLPPALAQAAELSNRSFARLSVADTGTGIPADILDKIFDPFFTTKEQGKGTGMGLSIVYGIVRDYGGEATVESVPGNGTTFHIYLPKSERLLESTLVASPVEIAGKEHILHVDDEVLLTAMTKKMLERMGYHVTTVNKSVEALEFITNQTEPVDLVITDYVMPTMTGLELTRHIKKFRPDLPVILCTGYSRQVNEDAARAAGVNEFMLKPFSKNGIAEVIRRVLQSSGRGDHSNV